MAINEEYILRIKNDKENAHREMMDLIKSKEQINLKLDRAKKTHGALSTLLLIAESSN